MNRRAAKRRACFHAATALETALGGGWESLDAYGEDRDLVVAGLQEIIAELDRRATGGAR